VIRAFIQARMSSRRFPGKVLAPLAGQPLIRRLLEQVQRVFPLDQITVLTSTESSDDPLACYVRSLGVAVYRGELDNVAARFQGCLRAYPCSWFVRVCADSPLLDSAVLQAISVHQERTDLDLVTNVYPRTFPKGQSVEMVNAETFAALNTQMLSVDEREHVTLVFYQQPQRFRILNVASRDPRQADLSFVVDTMDDLRRLETLWQTDVAREEGVWG
jgi:spore coat polysaccharide biosynthesis protein SpsF